MKYKQLWKRAAAAVLAVILLLSLAACGSGDPVSVMIMDAGQKIMVDGTDDMTVGQLIGSIGIDVNDKDVVSPPLDTVWKLANADSITIQRYAKVTVTDGETSKDVELVDGTYGQALEQSGFDMSQYSTDADLTARCQDGAVLTITRIGGNSEGSGGGGSNGGKVDGRQDVSITGNDEEGYVCVNADGQVASGYCDGVTVDGAQWIVIDGAATKVESERDKTLFAAAKDIAKCTEPSMTKEEKLRAAFDYLKSNYLEGVPHDPPYREDDWYIVCANDIFVNGKGDCYSYGAAFAFLGRAIGCSDCYACNSGGHGWAEVEGKVYDPEWSMHSNKYSYFAMTYDEPCDVDYSGGLDDGAEWKKKAI